MSDRRGKSQKASDDEAFPLCFGCHRAFHDAAGPFKPWDKTTRIEWQDAMVRFYRGHYAVSAEVF